MERLLNKGNKVKNANPYNGYEIKANKFLISQYTYKQNSAGHKKYNSLNYTERIFC